MFVLLRSNISGLAPGCLTLSNSENDTNMESVHDLLLTFCKAVVLGKARCEAVFQDVSCLLREA